MDSIWNMLFLLMKEPWTFITLVSPEFLRKRLNLWLRVCLTSELLLLDCWLSGSTLLSSQVRFIILLEQTDTWTRNKQTSTVAQLQDSCLKS